MKRRLRFITSHWRPTIALLIGVAGLASHFPVAVTSTVALSAGEPFEEAEAWHRRFVCIERSVREMLPADARVRIASDMDTQWRQRMIEFLLPRTAYVGPGDPADAVVAVRETPSGPCDGFELVLEPPH